MLLIWYRNHAFSVFVLSTQKMYPSFMKKVFVFQKISFKVKLLKLLKISTDCHIKIYRSLKRRYISKIRSTVIRRTYVGYKMKPLRKSAFQCCNKSQPKFCHKTCWKEQPYLIMECIELNWLFKHMGKVRSSQQPFLYWIE